MKTGKTGKTRTTKAGKPSPAFVVLAEDLRDRIAAGPIGPNERLPTEEELCEQYGVSRTTVRKAYDLLISEGVVVGRGRAGYFVREARPLLWRFGGPDGFVDPWEALLEAEGAARARRTVSVRVDPGDTPVRATTVAALLDLPATSLVACRATVGYLDDTPVALTDMYVPYDRVKDGPFMGAADLDVYTLLADPERGAHLDRADDTFAVRLPTAGEQALLDLPDGAAVVEVVRRLIYSGQAAMVVHALYGASDAEFATCARA